MIIGYYNFLASKHVFMKIIYEKIGIITNLYNKPLLYRLVWLIDFFEIQSLEGGDICYKRDEILKKKSNLVYFCSIFLKY